MDAIVRKMAQTTRTDTHPVIMVALTVLGYFEVVGLCCVDWFRHLFQCDRITPPVFEAT